MITVTKKFEFEAAHYLENHPGLCKNLHGHTFKLEVEVSGDILTNGMIVDFSDLKKIVNDTIIKLVDHKFLNDVFDFIPTSEKMVEYFAALLIGGFYSFQINSNFELERVRLYETTNSYAEWKR